MNTYLIDAPILGYARGQIVPENDLDGVEPQTLKNFIDDGLIVPLGETGEPAETPAGELPTEPATGLDELGETPTE